MTIRTGSDWRGPRPSQWASEEHGRVARAVKIGVGAAGSGLQQDLREALQAAGVTPAAGNMIGLKVYPRGDSLSAAASVYARGQRAALILSSFAYTRDIRPRGGAKYLAIPTGFNHRSGWRGMKRGNLVVTPQEMVAMKGMTFTRPMKNGRGLVWFLRVNVADARNARTRQIQRQAWLNAPRGPKLLGSGRRRRTDAILNGVHGPAGAVPMFLLLPSLRIAAKFNPAERARFWAGQIPDLIDRALPAQA